MAELRIGTCSWKYESWRGLIYSNLPEIDFLNEYSQFYNTVEIDQWFWSLHGLQKVTLPFPNVVHKYKRSVPEDFKFTIKLPNSLTLTHFYKKAKTDTLEENPYFFSDELFAQFLKSVGPLSENLGPLMFQFEYLNKQKMRSQFDFLARFSDFLRKIDRSIPLAVEIRNPNYFNKVFFEFLNEFDLAMVFLQGYYMPPIVELYNKFKEYIKGTVVIRLHGPDRKGIENITNKDWSKIVQPKDAELPGIVRMIESMLADEVDVYLNVNNHYEGSAPLTINKIKDMLK